MKALVGDKVRLKSAEHRGKRGVVVAVESRALEVEVDGLRIKAKANEVTNLSLAARKAWESMPNRRVGRPKGSRRSDRVSVTVRLDRALWERFRHLESAGVIEDRTATINAWLQEKTTQLTNGSRD